METTRYIGIAKSRRQPNVVGVGYTLAHSFNQLNVFEAGKINAFATLSPRERKCCLFFFCLTGIYKCAAG